MAWNLQACLFQKYNMLQCLKKQKAHPGFLIYVLVCTAQITKSMKTNNIQLKSPIKIQQEMQKKFEFSKICQIFRAFFEKAVFLENGRGRHETVAMPIQNSFIFMETQ